MVGVFATPSRILAEMPAKTLQEILARDRSRTAELLARSESLSRFAQRLSELLPTPLHGRVKLALLEDDRAVLLTDSPVWRSRLRFHMPQIKRLMRTQLAPRVTRIEIKVIPCIDERPTPTKACRLSERGARYLRQAADAIDDDTLSRALRRLAGRTRRGA